MMNVSAGESARLREQVGISNNQASCREHGQPAAIPHDAEESFAAAIRMGIMAVIKRVPPRDTEHVRRPKVPRLSRLAVALASDHALVRIGDVWHCDKFLQYVHLDLCLVNQL